MNGEFLPDTNIVIALFKNESSVIEKISGAKKVFISNVTVGELYFGAYKSNKIENNIRQIDDFVAKNTVLNCDSTTAFGNKIVFCF